MGPRFSRKALSRFFASSSPCAIAAVERLGGEARGGVGAAMRGNMWVTAKLVNGAFSAIRSREFEPLGDAGAVLDQILREADGLAFLGAERAPGQHHVHHAGDADERRQPHRAAAADIDAAASFRQRIEGRRSATRIWAAAASSSPPPTTAPCSTATTGTLPNWMRSNARCQERNVRCR